MTKFVMNFYWKKVILITYASFERDSYELFFFVNAYICVHVYITNLGFESPHDLCRREFASPATSGVLIVIWHPIDFGHPIPVGPYFEET